MHWGALTLALLIGPASIPAQDADSIVLKTDAPRYTIVSQVEDSVERSAFLNMLGAQTSELRYELANQFLAAYPRSWLLSQALDIAARSAIDLGKYDEAIADARFSLRLLPENPSLLILIANVEAQQGQLDRAVDHSNRGLEYLDQIEHPANVTEQDWQTLKPQLRASGYFARARAVAGRALGVTPHDNDKLSQAQQDLDLAAAWNSADPEIFYLRAIVELNRQNRSAAAADLAFVVHAESPLREKARHMLSILAGSKDVDSWVATLPSPKVEAHQRDEPKTQANNGIVGGYAGPEPCKPCHLREYTNWRKTGMARMLQPYRRENILGDFSTGLEYKDAADIIRMGIDSGRDGKPYFEFSNGDTFSRFYVDYTIGSKWQQAYATQLPDGRLQVIPIEYNLLQKSWLNYWKIIDPRGTPRDNVGDFPKLTAATNYQQNCAICHTSQLRLNSGSADPMQHAMFLESGIDCEMCHGPSAGHVEQMKKGGANDSRSNIQAPFDFRTASNRAGVRVCAQCHRQSQVRSIGDSGEMNYSSAGDFVPQTSLRPFDVFSRKAFYKDGRFRETTFIVEAFTRSACYLRGTAQCATCHSPHLDNFESNPTSLKFQKDPNEMCLGCHVEFRAHIAQHTHHKLDTEASQCVSCHMPRIMNALLFRARSHQIEIPSADLTERFGQQDSPNVCLDCHKKESVEWVKRQLASWRD